MRAWLVLVVALLLAGCAREAPAGPLTYPPGPTSATPTPGNPAFPGQGIVEQTLTSSAYHLDAAAPRFDAELTIPNGTTQVLVDLSWDQGAAVGFQVRLAGCAFDVGGPVPGDGRNVTIDCGGLYPGAATLSLEQGQGAIAGRVAVLAKVCRLPDAGCYRMP